MQIGRLDLASGGFLEDVTLGYEVYGREVGAAPTILICHPFPATSHAAGRHHPDDAAPGFWDGVIGPGRAIDTDRHCVIAVDALGCLNHAAAPETTRADRVDLKTNRPMGVDFPQITVADMVNAQRRLIDSLGVSDLGAVAGPSMGAMQALQWAAAYPDSVGCVIAAIPYPMRDALTVELLGRWVRPIERALDQGGDLDAALREACLTVALDAAGRDDPGFDPELLHAGADARARTTDPWTFLRLTQALIDFDLVPEAVRCPVLLLPAESDHLFPPALSRRFAHRAPKAETRIIPGYGGHLDGIGDGIARVSDVISAFLSEQRDAAA